MDTKTLDIDLKRGVVPISAAAAQLAKLIKRTTNTPIVITRKPPPAAVLISIETFAALKALAEARQ